MSKSTTDKYIYFDNQSTTPVDKRVRELMLPYLDETFGNPHSNDHYFGWTSKKAVDSARHHIATLIGADADEIIFTSGATEANNLGILGFLPELKRTGRTQIVVSTFEHKCILQAAHAAATQGFEVIYLSPSNDGLITPTTLRTAIKNYSRIGLISVMTVNNEIGTIQPITELCHVAHEIGAFFHTDAVQGAAFLDLDVTKTDVDLLSLSAHKIYGPKGIGCLYIRRTLQKQIKPIIHGGGQEFGLRSGTIPTMLCVGFGEACSIALKERGDNAITLKSLSSYFWDKLKAACPETILNGNQTQRHPGNLNVQFPGIDSHSLLQAIQPSVAASTGSACSTGTPEPSHVLRAIGLSDDAARSSIRFSFGQQNTIEQVDIAIDHIIKAIRSKAL